MGIVKRAIALLADGNHTLSPRLRWNSHTPMCFAIDEDQHKKPTNPEYLGIPSNIFIVYRWN